MTINKNEKIFAEKFRPKTVQDIILPEEYKTQVRKWIQNDIPNLLLVSKQPGLGKTSLAHVLIEESKADALFINISLNGNIDTLRSKIQGFVSTIGFSDRPKVVVLDEFDGASMMLQKAMRGFIEEYSKSARFIMTANSREKIIEPLQNRLQVMDFDEIFKTYRSELIKMTAHRIIDILKYEGIEYTKEDLLVLLKQLYPSTRAILIAVQENIRDGKLDISQEKLQTISDIDEIIESIKKKDYEKYRTQVQEMSLPDVLFTEIYSRIDEFDIHQRPEITIIIAKYSYQHAFARDQLVNIQAMGAEIMKIL